MFMIIYDFSGDYGVYAANAKFEGKKMVVEGIVKELVIYSCKAELDQLT